MANSVIVFGNPITNETLKGMPDYANKVTITNADRARAALNMKDAAGNKQANADDYVEKLKTEWAHFLNMGGFVIGLMHNCTGNPVTFVTTHDYRGEVIVPYKTTIGNGQTAAFLHANTTSPVTGLLPGGSSAAVVYRYGNKEENMGNLTDFMQAWSFDPYLGKYDKKVYTEIHEAGPWDWNSIYGSMEKNGGTKHRAEWKNFISYVSVDQICGIPVFQGTMTIKII